MTTLSDEPFNLLNIKVRVKIPQSTADARAAELADLIRSYIDKTMGSVEAHLRSLYEPRLDIEVVE